MLHRAFIFHSSIKFLVLGAIATTLAMMGVTFGMEE